jgi:vacuolar-type H+-ATPase subunit H
LRNSNFGYFKIDFSELKQNQNHMFPNDQNELKKKRLLEELEKVQKIKDAIQKKKEDALAKAEEAIQKKKEEDLAKAEEAIQKINEEALAKAEEAIQKINEEALAKEKEAEILEDSIKFDILALPNNEENFSEEQNNPIDIHSSSSDERYEGLFNFTSDESESNSDLEKMSSDDSRDSDYNPSDEDIPSSEPREYNLRQKKKYHPQ